MAEESPKSVVDNRRPDNAGRGLPSRKMLYWVGGAIGVLVMVLTIIDSAMPKHHAHGSHHTQTKHRDTASEKPNNAQFQHLLNKQVAAVPPPTLPRVPSAVIAPSTLASEGGPSTHGPEGSLPPTPAASTSNPNPYANVYQPVSARGRRARALRANILASGIIAQKGGKGAPHPDNTGLNGMPFMGQAPPAPTPLSGMPAMPTMPAMPKSLAGMLGGKQRPPSRTHSYRRYLSQRHAAKPQGPARIARARRGVAITPGTPIPAILLTRVSTQLPGSVIAQITRTIYSPTGRVAIPSGTKVVGSYDSKVFNGQSRTLLAFRNLIFPNGDTLRLPGTEAAGIRGTAGVSAHVNNHLWSSLGAAFLVAELSNVANLGGGGASSTYNYGGGGGSSSLGAGGQVIVNQAQNILNPYMNIPPTLIVEPGKAITIMVMRTVEFAR